MSCPDCKCNICANSVEIGPTYFTPGDGDFPCFTCDECRHYDGDYNKKSMWRPDCAKYKEPEKRRNAKAKEAAAKTRKQIYLIK